MASNSAKVTVPSDSGGKGDGDRSSRRLSGVNPDTDFPPCQEFQPPTMLPTYASVIGRLRYLTLGGKWNMESKQAVREVSKEIYCKLQ